MQILHGQLLTTFRALPQSQEQANAAAQKLEVFIPKLQKIGQLSLKKNQVFWTRIDYFRNGFGTLAYPDVTWSVSLKRTFGIDIL